MTMINELTIRGNTEYYLAILDTREEYLFRVEENGRPLLDVRYQDFAAAYRSFLSWGETAILCSQVLNNEKR